MTKVSVVVPVYNPGSDIDDCIRSLLDQSLDPDEYEVVFVDDGSTDETPERLDQLAAVNENVRAFHIPNSGWPGRPRNVGMDHARGDFVYFVDNDDWLTHEALERMHAVALRDDADIVIGKVVGRGKKVPRSIFRQNRSGLSMSDCTAPLGLLTPHKLFRRSMLVDNEIRFPEGRRRLEDHVFVVHAYFHAKGVSVLADHPCYYWVLREDRSNASARRWDPVAYYANVREVLDIVEAHTEPGPQRDRLLSHWYRGKMLGRVGGPAFLRRDPAWRREIFLEVRKLAIERYDTKVEEELSFRLRVRSRLLRHGDQGLLEELAAAERGLRAEASVRSLTEDADRLELSIQGRLHGPVAVSRDEERLVWRAPPRVREALDDDSELFDITRELRGSSRVQLILRSIADDSELLLPAETSLRLEPGPDDDGTLMPVLDAQVQVTARTAAAGSPLRPGEWELLANIGSLGFASDAALELQDGTNLRIVVTEDGTMHWARQRGSTEMTSPSRDPKRGKGAATVTRRLRHEARLFAKNVAKRQLRRWPSLYKRIQRARRRRAGLPILQSPAGDRLLEAPVFILCSVRSGSTLLRVVLNSHSQIHSPHELHLRDVSVHVKKGYPRQALREIGLGPTQLTYLLWDRILHRELRRSGKQFLVNKTPSDVHIAGRILECWGDARLIFLLRHPAAIANSRQKVRKQDSSERNLEVVLRYCEALEEARETYPGLTVRYEELTSDPERVTSEICHWLGVPWEREMLDYQRQGHGRFRPGFGDWTEKIRSGTIEPAPPPPSPDDVPDELRGLCEAWGYLPRREA